MTKQIEEREVRTSPARATEAALKSYIFESVLSVVGKQAAKGLMDEYDNFAAINSQQEPLTRKVSRLRKTAKGRERLAKAATWDDVRRI